MWQALTIYGGREVLLQTRHIRKQFNGIYALDRIDFEIKKGEVHGLVEQRIGGVAEAFLKSGAEGADHHVGCVVDEDVSLHVAGIGHGR